MSISKVLSAIICGAALLWAQPAKTPTAAKSGGKTPRAASQKMEGTLLSVDEGAKTMIIQVNYQMTLDPASTASLKTAKPGTKIAASYYKTPDGKRMVTNITSKGATPAHPKKVKKKAKQKAKAKAAKVKKKKKDKKAHAGKKAAAPQKAPRGKKALEAKTTPPESGKEPEAASVVKDTTKKASIRK